MATLRCRVRVPSGSGQYLVESKQVRNGNERYRDKIPGEQTTRDEYAVAAAMRGVEQELGDTLMTKAILA